MLQPAIKTNDLSYSFGRGYNVVNKLNLSVPQNSIYGFLGPNGAGKTTTIKLLTGMLLAERDNIFIYGQSLQKNIPHIFQSIGTLIETPSLYLHLTARENLRIICTLRDLPSSRIEEVLNTVGLADVKNKIVKHFSLGMKQRLGISMSLLPDPQLLILDEPANGLDPTGIIEIRELLKNLHVQHGKTIFVSSHLLNEIEKTCTHIGIIHKGVLQYEGSLQQMQESAQNSGEVIFRIPAASEWLEKLREDHPGLKQLSRDEILIPFTKQGEVAAINEKLVKQQVPVYGINVRGGLEDWFIRLTQNDKQIV